MSKSNDEIQNEVPNEKDTTDGNAVTTNDAPAENNTSTEDAQNGNSMMGLKVETKTGKSTNSNSSNGWSNVDTKPSKSGSAANVENTWNVRIGFLGAGRLSECIIRGLLRTARIAPKQLFVAAKSTRNLDTFKMHGISTSTRSYDIFGKFDCDLVFIAVHGNVIRHCFKSGGTRPLALTTNYIPSRSRTIYVLSLVGGIPLADLRMTLLNPEKSESSNKHHNKLQMHRIMLNASVAYGLGLGAIDVEVDSKKCSPIIRDILQLMAKLEWLSTEQNMDVLCALAGNGITFVYYFISALADGGFKMGLSKAMAIKLATKMMQGAALVILETGKSPSKLLDESTSASGAAVYGLSVLDKQECASGICQAVEAAYRRVKELAD